MAEAQRRTKELALPIEFHRGDIYDIQFDDEVFHGARAERVLEHLDHPEKALSELVRVTKQGGRVVAISPDFDSYAFDFPDRDIARKLTHFMCELRVNGWAGRRPFCLICLRALCLRIVYLAQFERTSFGVNFPHANLLVVIICTHVPELTIVVIAFPDANLLATLESS